MLLSPYERERLMLGYAAELARRRQAWGGQLVTDLMQSGRTVLSRDDVMVGAPELLEVVQLEATFPGRDGAGDRSPPDPVSEALVPSGVIPAGGSIETPPGAPRIERADEEPDRWTGTTRIERAGCPVLHTTVGLGPAAPARLPPAAPRAYASTVLLAPADPRPEVEVITGDDAVRLPLPGGWVGTAWGRELVDTVARLAALDGAVAGLETAR